MEYEVETGGTKKIVEADDPKEAAKTFIKKYYPKNIGFLVSILQVGKGEKDRVYLDPIVVLKEMGLYGNK